MHKQVSMIKYFAISVSTMMYVLTHNYDLLHAIPILSTLKKAPDTLLIVEYMCGHHRTVSPAATRIIH
jgi:hypothetical protein